MIEHSKEYRAYMAEKDLNENASQFADSLLLVMQIKPHQKELVQICGKRGDKNNRAAIRSWVKGQLCCASCMTEHVVQTIRKKLQRYLSDAVESSND